MVTWRKGNYRVDCVGPWGRQFSTWLKKKNPPGRRDRAGSVGLGRFELPTSRLSEFVGAMVSDGGRGNHWVFVVLALVGDDQRWWALVQVGVQFLGGLPPTSLERPGVR